MDRVPELQETARKANGGALGCGHGTLTLVTRRGEIKIGTGLDPIHVFGNRIVVADLLNLLQARVESNRTGETNPMSGDVSDLGYVILSTLGQSSDPDTLPVIRELINDGDDSIRAWAAIALIRLAESDDDLKTEIEKITFPKPAVQSASGRGVKFPDWAKVSELN